MPFQDISYLERRETICAVLDQGIIRNISVKLFGPVVQEMSFKDRAGIFFSKVHLSHRKSAIKFLLGTIGSGDVI